MSLKIYQSKLPKYAGHTAGPWKPRFTSTSRILLAGHTKKVVNFYYSSEVPWREQEANDALIADAPFLACEVERLTALCGELVGALTELTEFVESEADEAGLCEYVESEMAYREASAKARAKIDKAKGGDE